MNSKQIETEIEGLQVALQKHRQAMDQTLDRFVEEQTPQMKQWISITVKSTVEEKHERIAQLSDEQIQLLKHRIAEVTENVGMLAARLAKVDQPHYIVRESYNSYAYDAGIDFPMQRVYRGAVSSLGNVFAEFGLINRHEDGAWKLTNGSFRYEYGFADSRGGAAGQYRVQYGEYQKLLEKIREKELDLKKARAAERFDSL